MRIETNSGVTVYDFTQGESLLKTLLAAGSVQSVECVKAIQPVVTRKAKVLPRVIWSIFWFAFFMPMIIVVLIFSGYTTKTTFIDGQWNVTLKDGSRFIIHDNEQHILDSAKAQAQQGFLTGNLS